MQLSMKFLFPLILGAGLGTSGCHHAANPESVENARAVAEVESKAVSKNANQMQLVAEGSRQTLSYKATQFGYIYLYDQTTGQFLFRGPINAKERFAFEPGAGHAELNKQRLDLERISNARDEYSLYFVPQ